MRMTKSSIVPKTIATAKNISICKNNLATPRTLLKENKIGSKRLSMGSQGTGSILRIFRLADLPADEAGRRCFFISKQL